MLADVDAGTDTPSFVGKVLAWRERDKEAALKLWTDLGKANDTLAELLRELCELEEDPQYLGILAVAARIQIKDCDITRPISHILAQIHSALSVSATSSNMSYTKLSVSSSSDPISKTCPSFPPFPSNPLPKPASSMLVPPVLVS